ncbi:YcnI family copper-binding membrane protein [Streptomyces sp. URMC 123]|uniref:YcnI family copper-binding membrane protein n=1 Tax=Streptomyces sp. URMC 123 TaxID=3423403 RepID=UPI003F1D8B13
MTPRQNLPSQPFSSLPVSSLPAAADVPAASNASARWSAVGSGASRRPSRRARLALVAGAAAGGVLLCAGPAFAHVTVDPGEAAQGGFKTIAFKVPNERDNASTVKLEISLPTDHPLATVMPKPVPGWKHEVSKSALDKPIEIHGKKINEAVTKVTWTADGSKIEPGTFQDFPLLVGRLPKDTDKLVFKALQTYDNNEVVRWIEEPKDGGPEPESPAPVLKLTPATGDGHAAAKGGSGAAADGKAASAKGGDDASGKAAEQAAGDGGSDTTARVLGGIGIAVGVAGLAFGVFAGRRRSA